MFTVVSEPWDRERTEGTTITGLGTERLCDWGPDRLFGVGHGCMQFSSCTWFSPTV